MFKNLSDILTPAPQHKHFAGPDGDGPITLEHHHASIEAIRLKPTRGAG